jgi:predicted TIM-barrel fold metal-dependent hydrolase
MPQRYELGPDVDALEAIDTHVHIEVDHEGHTALPRELVDAAGRYFHADTTFPGLDEVAQYYRERKLAAVVFTVDAGTTLGHIGVSSAEIAEGAARNNDVLIPFGSVDPLTGPDAMTSAQRLVEESGVRGFKFHPTVQGFDPSDPAFWPLYAKLEEFGLPVIFHTGQTGIGAGLPGGAGLKLWYSNPMLLDVVAAGFPGLPIIMAHPSVPWQDEAIAVATHKANVWIDLSGWSPKYFPEALVRQANSLLQDRVLFGSDFPLLKPDRWLADFAALELKDAVRPKILKQNAVRLLGLTSTTTPTSHDEGIS